MIRSTPSSYAAAARADAWAVQLTWYLDSTAGDDTNDGAALASVGASLNVGVNELVDVLNTFFLNVVSEDDDCRHS